MLDSQQSITKHNLVIVNLLQENGQNIYLHGEMGIGDRYKNKLSNMKQQVRCSIEELYDKNMLYAHNVMDKCFHGCSIINSHTWRVKKKRIGKNNSFLLQSSEQMRSLIFWCINIKPIDRRLNHIFIPSLEFFWINVSLLIWRQEHEFIEPFLFVPTKLLNRPKKILLFSSIVGTEMDNRIIENRKLNQKNEKINKKNYRNLILLWL